MPCLCFGLLEQSSIMLVMLIICLRFWVEMPPQIRLYLYRSFQEDEMVSTSRRKEK